MVVIFQHFIQYPGDNLLYVEDVDSFVARALEAGAKITMPLEETFWGDRYGVLVDPFGHSWSVATHVRDVSPEALQAAALKVFSDSGTR